jgi:hypothetical protein
MISRLRSLAAWRPCAAAVSDAGSTEVGWKSLPPEETTTWPKRPSCKDSVTVAVWRSRPSMPSNGSRSVAARR